MKERSKFQGRNRKRARALAALLALSQLGALVFPAAGQDAFKAESRRDHGESAEGKGVENGSDQPDPFSGEAQRAMERLLEQSEAGAEEENRGADRYFAPGQIRSLTRKVGPSVVTVRQLGRDGGQRGTGSGFVVDAEGLIATNLHVIGEGRSIEVEFADGEVRRPVEVTASDRLLDLAVIRIDPVGLGLRALELAGGKAETDEGSPGAIQGQLIAGFGAPRGLEFSVVPGAVSAVRILEPGFLGEETPDYPMIQIAMPIEQGNSGGPVVDLEGRVLGVVTLKHRQTANLGFAVPADNLRKLLDRPNPIAMSRWRTIGAIDAKRWEVVRGADWTQRGGVIKAENPGDGFGGRSLLVSREDAPGLPYEVAARVRLGDESGAAGLVFASDGGDVHYGFYPSGGRIRLTRFEGPDVYSWTILEQLGTPAYRPGEWNRVRVRVEEEKIIGFVNGERVMEISDAVLRGGRVGLCKFRDTVAEFREFKVGASLEEKAATPELTRSLGKSVERFAAAGRDGSGADMIEDLRRDPAESARLLAEKAGELEDRAEELRALRDEIHVREVEESLLSALGRDEEKIDLFEVGLQIARIDDRRLDLEHYRALFDRFVEEAGAYLESREGEAERKGGGKKKEKRTWGDGPSGTDGTERVTALLEFLFEENGFHGSRSEYYHHANSYLNRVLDDREGIPVTLSVLAIEMARRLGIEGVFGASAPGHFLIGYRENGDDLVPTAFYDAFDGGKRVPMGEERYARLRKNGSGVEEDLTDSGEKEEELTGPEIQPLASADDLPAYFRPATARQIAVRMLRNLILIEIERETDPAGAAPYLDLLLAVDPDSAQERFQRALIHLQEDRLAQARVDLDWLLEHRPPGIDHGRLREFRERLGDE